MYVHDKLPPSGAAREGVLPRVINSDQLYSHFLQLILGARSHHPRPERGNRYRHFIHWRCSTSRETLEQKQCGWRNQTHPLLHPSCCCCFSVCTWWSSAGETQPVSSSDQLDILTFRKQRKYLLSVRPLRKHRRVPLALAPPEIERRKG